MKLNDPFMAYRINLYGFWYLSAMVAGIMNSSAPPSKRNHIPEVLYNQNNKQPILETDRQCHFLLPNLHIFL